MGFVFLTIHRYNMAKTGTEIIPTPEIADGNVSAMTKMRLKNMAMLTNPSFARVGKYCLFGSDGFMANNIRPAGRARSAPRSKGGQSCNVYCVTE
ncbi:protein of unknown function [Vibrio tapetis subsp. tapetis]|uniref:Uncharacterized protein n=1 Tax=Vibrio tapetis subsp. tapetis TaxID=1671868 RepID=A0A2N8ZIJ9_9VIBR|nr:protein of unknown function [Vibrio tapetis subsp. tapetis]